MIRVFLLPLCLMGTLAAETYTWQQLRDRFEGINPTLLAGQLNIAESRAAEVTAFLRPNPELNLFADQFEPFNSGPYRPLAALLNSTTLSYLHERRHKRELRRESAEKATGIAESQQADLTRMLLFNLRNSFNATLQAKAVLAVARENIQQYDRVLQLNRARKDAGDISQVDLDRLELQRIQFEGDLQTADINLRTAKIQLLALLSERTALDNFDVTGPFAFNDAVTPLAELRQAALQNRPDLRAAIEAVDKAQTDHRLAIANGSTDPTFSFDYGRNPPLINYLGVGVSFPLRVFDRNQGEKARTDIDIQRQDRLRQASEAQVFSDVDSAWSTLNNTVTLLRPYRDRYLAQSARIRDTINFAYQRGAASLLDFLQAQQEYRSTQVNYLNLVGAYLNAASQLNMAVGREVIP